MQSTRSGAPKVSPEWAFAELRDAATFEEGVVGFVATQTDRIVAFHALLQEDSPSPFERLLDVASPAGRVYALCGLQITDPVAYRTAANSMKEDFTGVTTHSGCILSHSTVAQLAREIDEEYDFMTSSALERGIDLELATTELCAELAGIPWPPPPSVWTRAGE